jgi:hypothetical protein
MLRAAVAAQTKLGLEVSLCRTGFLCSSSSSNSKHKHTAAM